MSPLEIGQQRVETFEVALARNGQCLLQAVRDPGECRNHDDRPTLLPRTDDAPDRADPLGIGHRGPAEFHHDQRALLRGSRPAAASSSALSSVPPAAPRSVLCDNNSSLIPNTGQSRTRPTTTVIPPPTSRSRRG